MCYLIWEVSVTWHCSFAGFWRECQKKKERRTGKEKGCCRTVGGFKKIKDVVRTVLQSGPLQLRAAIVVSLCSFQNVMDMYLCSVGIAFGHWPGTIKEKKKHHLRLWAVLCFMCPPSVCQCVSCLHAWFYSHILDVANQHQILREKEPRPLPLAGLPHIYILGSIQTNSKLNQFKLKFVSLSKYQSLLYTRMLQFILLKAN